ncbi:putative 14-3-3 protein like protein [Blattamonas nauphoetae]|uniref:14-3-3 protein like protein n=1 Tax=Blattamonas nauphoetae TaxID=2049346 RepID=A0ABQ9Y401_9EUKA|nr:putative 14-3-3 protein like protein [Blattamonas nauphoetae]
MIAQIPIPSHLQPLRSIPPAIIHSTHNEHSQNPPTQSAPLTSPSPEAEEPTLNSPFPDTPSKRKRGRPLGAWGRKRRRTEHISQRRELSKLMKEDDVLKNKLEQQALLEKRKENRVKKIVESLVLPETVWQNQKNQSPPHPPAGPIATEPEPKEDIAGDSSNSFPWSDETTPPIKPEPLPKEDSPPKTPVALPPPPILDIVRPNPNPIQKPSPQERKKGSIRRYLPEQKKAELLLDSENVHFGEVNCDRNPVFCRNEKIAGYPTIRFYRNGTYIEYLGDRLASSIYLWFHNQTYNDTRLFTNKNDADTFLANTSYALVAHVPYKECSEFILFQTVASLSDTGAQHVVVVDPSIQEPLIYFYDSDGNVSISYHGENRWMELLLFEETHSLPILDEINELNAPLYVEGSLPFCAVFVNPRLKTTPSLLRSIKKVAAQFRGTITFAWADIRKYSRIAKLMGQDKEEFPLLSLEMDNFEFLEEQVTLERAKYLIHQKHVMGRNMTVEYPSTSVLPQYHSKIHFVKGLKEILAKHPNDTDAIAKAVVSFINDCLTGKIDRTERSGQLNSLFPKDVNLDVTYLHQPITAPSLSYSAFESILECNHDAFLTLTHNPRYTVVAFLKAPFSTASKDAFEIFRKISRRFFDEMTLYKKSYLADPEKPLAGSVIFVSLDMTENDAPEDTPYASIPTILLYRANNDYLSGEMDKKGKEIYRCEEPFTYDRMWKFVESGVGDILSRMKGEGLNEEELDAAEKRKRDQDHDEEHITRNTESEMKKVIDEEAQQRERYEQLERERKAAMEKEQKEKGEVEGNKEEETTLFEDSCKMAIRPLRSSFKIMTAIELKEEQKQDLHHVELIRDCKQKVETEAQDICNDILNILKTNLIPSATREQDLIIYHRMIGDYNRYLAEFVSGTAKQDAARNARQNYQTATEMGKAHLPPESPDRLSVAMNYSTFFFDILNSTDRAIAVAKEAFDDAIGQIDKLEEKEFVRASMICQLLRDNISLWTRVKTEEEDEQ